MKDILIRPFRDSDAPALAEIFHRAVREGAKKHYSRAQRLAWSPAPPAGPKWLARLKVADTLVAESKGAPVGFMTLNLDTGYLDFAYTAPEAMGLGVTEALYAVLEGRARVAGCAELTTEASRLAERFFLKRGWHLVARQDVERQGVNIPNARMAKRLDAMEAVA